MTTYNFTAFSEEELLNSGSGNGSSLGRGDSFTMPAGADIEMSVRDDDRYLSGDGCYNDHAADRYGQKAAIKDCEGNDVGNGGQIYAEKYYWVSDSDGNWYVMINIEQEGSGADYFTFYTGAGYSTPEPGVELTVHSSCDVRGSWIDYKCLDAGEKGEEPGSICGTLFNDADCDGVQDEGMEICTLGPDLLVNGDFEDNYLNDKGAEWNINSCDLPGWYLIGSGNADLLEENAEGHGNAKGQAIIDLDCGAILCQVVNVPEAGTYVLSLDLLENPHIRDSDNRIKVYINGQAVEIVTAEGQSTVEIELQLDAGSTRIDLKSLTTKMDGPGIDAVRLQKKTVEIIDAEDGIEGITVVLLDANGDEVLGEDGERIETLTDADGNYTFDSVPPGDYRVKFEKPDGTDFTFQDVGDDDTIDSDVDGNGVSNVISVGSGEKVKDVDAGVKPGAQLGSIAGRYFCDENRNDVDDGEPGVAGVTVVLSDAAGNFIAETLTDDNGDYLFENLEAGTYKVTFPEFVADPEPPTPVDPDNVQSDDFSSGEIEPFWTFAASPNVPSSAEVVIENGDALLCLTVEPGDSDPNPADGMNDAARLLQQIADADFQVETAFKSTPAERFELQGVMVEEDAANWMRFDIRANSPDDFRLFVGYADDGVSTVVFNGGIDDPADAAAMRVTRSGDDWTFEISADGVVWNEVVTFTHDGISPNAVGPFIGAAPPEADGYTAKIDYFYNSQARIDYDDRSLNQVDDGGKVFVAQDAGDDDTVDSDVNEMGMTDVISLAEGENKTDVDAGVKGPPLGAIGDTIWYDSFGDGVLQDFEARASGITVFLKNGDGDIIAETTTNLDGTYIFDNLEAGDYSIQVAMPDTGDYVFTVANAGGDDMLDSDVDPLTGMSQVITLAEGEQNFTIDAGLLLCGMIEGTSQSDQNSPVGGNDLLIGCDASDTIIGLSGEDTLVGNDGDDELFGFVDNDVLIGGAGNDIIDGGELLTGGGGGSADMDVAVYDGVMSDYAIVGLGNGMFTVTDLNLLNGFEGVDTLIDVEVLRFSDGDFVL